MPTKAELRNRLIEKLKELFQLDRPELDFGLYRIMHAKDEEVTDYLENGLPATLEEALGDVNQDEIEKCRREYEEELQTAKDYGVENPEEADKVQEAKERLEAVKERAGADKKVYDHLYRFFSRYYEKGDFITRRYRVRETDTEAAPYAIPYNGEEVKLHWANADQYYIKTTEHFRNFRFDLRKAVDEVANEDASDLDLADEDSLLVHFRIVEGEEGNQENEEDSGNKVRKLKPHTSDLLEVTEDGELVVNFEVVFQKSQGEYIYDEDMEERLEDEYGTSVGKNDKEPLAVAETVFDHLSGLDGLDSAYEDLIRYVPPPRNKSTPPLLANYYERFADKHEMDYFIHKDLGRFLRRELDFYIKNEVMRLDNIERAGAPRVKSYLDIVKALRRVAHDIIDFLAQLEDFQRRLWLKKKFVVDSQYCVTLDLIPNSLYGQVCKNTKQVREWKEKFSGDDMIKKIEKVGEEGKVTVNFLEENQDLIVDTKHFRKGFKQEIVASLKRPERSIDGLLVSSENFQGMNILKNRFKQSVDVSYLDPPYNTKGRPIMYKNNYKKSSWCSFIRDRLELAREHLSDNGVCCITIDDYQQQELHYIVESLFGEKNYAGTVAIRSNPPGRPIPSGFAVSHEYAIFAGKTRQANISRLERSDSQLQRYNKKDEKGRYMWELFRKRGSESRREDRPKMFYPFYWDGDDLRIPEMEWNDEEKEWIVKEGPIECEEVFYPVDESGMQRRWRWGVDSVKEDLNIFKIDESNDGNKRVYYKYRPPEKGVLPKTLWYESKFSATEHGTNVLNSMFPDYSVFDFPKSIHAVEECLTVASLPKDGTCLDAFAGSGTTAHSIIKMNREDKGSRKFVLLELGEYFEDVLLDRVKKAAYSSEWSDGEPRSREPGESHLFKYIRLESYEDTINNLALNKNEHRRQLLEQDEDLRRDYRLHYMLDVETEGSPSLLDIDEFTDPRQYHLQVKKSRSDASTQRSVDLLETFNYLLGLRVEQINMPETFTADFHRPEDPELPEDERTRLEIDGEMEPDEDGDWWFRTVTGWVPSDPMNPDDSDQERILVIWRTLTDDRERDNAMLNAYVGDQRDDLLDVDRVYVNGSNNLASLRREDEDWEVHLLEKEFMERMWDVQDV